jgi:hypothetical protein
MPAVTGIRIHAMPATSPLRQRKALPGAVGAPGFGNGRRPRDFGLASFFRPPAPSSAAVTMPRDLRVLCPRVCVAGAIPSFEDAESGPVPISSIPFLTFISPVVPALAPQTKLGIQGAHLVRPFGFFPPGPQKVGSFPSRASIARASSLISRTMSAAGWTRRTRLTPWPDHRARASISPSSPDAGV